VRTGSVCQIAVRRDNCRSGYGSDRAVGQMTVRTDICRPGDGSDKHLSVRYCYGDSIGKTEVRRESVSEVAGRHAEGA
jgi:hypothetical protein